VDYLFRNPSTGRIAPKSVYVEAVDGIILGCGIYLEKGAAQPEPTRRTLPRLVASPRPS